MELEVKLDLGPAERNVVTRLLDSQTKGDLATARLVRAVRKGLKLRELDKIVNDLVVEARDKKGVPIDWDYLLEANEKIDPEFQLRTFHLERTVASTLHDLLLARNWAKGKDKDNNDIDSPVPLGLLVAVANLADAMSKVINGGDKCSKSDPAQS